ncbi:hypothetical protein Q4Q34_03470 [Flavivirga abyssicola]|uniref:hypothetical protein n=1 Tax=Flavivirga abyssicola TaxID=3063533 RepID=UPI0026E0E4AB|nr:hypothetical protein [Flavivirga sp. MEBiC07777]WVK14088.1 hypothetical protein Q4Q34_03470 [Flavivirga sp. MEBiC07777]
MIRLAFIFSLLFTLNTTAITNGNTDGLKQPTCEEHYLDVSSIEVYEIDEEIEIGFDTKAYLPENFNPLKGLHDIDWSVVEIYKVEEEVELGFDTEGFLPRNFNPLK